MSSKTFFEINRFTDFTDEYKEKSQQTCYFLCQKEKVFIKFLFKYATDLHISMLIIMCVYHMMLQNFMKNSPSDKY